MKLVEIDLGLYVIYNRKNIHGLLLKSVCLENLLLTIARSFILRNIKAKI